MVTLNSLVCSVSGASLYWFLHWGGAISWLLLAFACFCSIRTHCSTIHFYLPAPPDTPCELAPNKFLFFLKSPKYHTHPLLPAPALKGYHYNTAASTPIPISDAPCCSRQPPPPISVALLCCCCAAAANITTPPPLPSASSVVLILRNHGCK
jgi:hypothetical protein